MKAVVYRKYGTAEVLQIGELPTPAPKPTELRIRTHACEVTKADCELRSATFPVKWFALPLRLALGVRTPRNPVLGGYIAGVVDAVGEKVTGFKTGDRVFGSTGFRFGGYAEYVCVPQSATLVKLPDSVPFEAAAASILGGLNALHFMALADLKQGESILINGAGGSIGSFAVQIAKSKGAHVTVVDAAHKLAFLNEVGADSVIDYTKTPLTSIEDKFDVVFNMVAHTEFETLVARLKPDGRFLTGNPKLIDMFKCWRLNRTTSQHGYFAFAEESMDELKELCDGLEQKMLVAPIDGLFSREEIVQAHKKVETETRLGAVVLAHP